MGSTIPTVFAQSPASSSRKTIHQLCAASNHLFSDLSPLLLPSTSVSFVTLITSASPSHKIYYNYSYQFSRISSTTIAILMLVTTCILISNYSNRSTSPFQYIFFIAVELVLHSTFFRRKLIERKSFFFKAMLNIFKYLHYTMCHSELHQYTPVYHVNNKI